MCRWTASLIRPSRSVEKPASSGLPAGTEPAAARSAALDATSVAIERRFVSVIVQLRSEVLHGTGLNFASVDSFLKFVLVMNGCVRYCGSSTTVVTTNQSPATG